jgi:hypothetical protein
MHHASQSYFKSCSPRIYIRGLLLESLIIFRLIPYYVNEISISLFAIEFLPPAQFAIKLTNVI